MKLQQGQVWKKGDEFIRIVRVERTEVEYKSMLNLSSRDGTHLTTSKKEFCRLLKDAVLLSSDEIQAEQFNGSLAGSKPGTTAQRKVSKE